MDDMEIDSNPSEDNNISEQKGYVDTEGNEKCQKEKPAQISFLKERDEKRKNAKLSYQSYVTKLTGYVTIYDASCTTGTATSASRWQTCPNLRGGAEE
ncbi:MAG: hypothetical protein BGO77_04785 [Caedibacter sp. 37-49]|nr:MAG: hypothetical protein BGO77_04785 [Caedibacter sp. 37-49]